MKKLLSFILAIIICLSVFPLTVLAEDEIPEGFERIATYYYDKSNPYNNTVQGNSDYGYKCYEKNEYGFKYCIFVHNGKIVTDESLIKPLTKMYFANNWQRNTSAKLSAESANEFVAISKDLKVNSFVDGVTKIASKCLGSLTSIYLTAGTATSAEIMKVVVDQTADQIKDSFFDVSNVISELHLAMLHVVADDIEDCILQIRNMGGETLGGTYKYCEEFCDVFTKLQRLERAERELVSEAVKKLEPSLIKNLANYFGEAANCFVGGFSEFLKDADKISELKKNNPQFISQAIELATRAKEVKDNLTEIEDFEKIFSDFSDSVIKESFHIFEAYNAYNSLETISLNVQTSSNLKLLDIYNLNDDVTTSNSITNNPTSSSTTTSTQTYSKVDLTAFNAKLSEFKKNRYANGSTYIDDPNVTGGYQCFGFANELAKYIFGSYPTSSMSATSVNAGWRVTYGGAAIDDLCVGDIVRYHYHSIFITKIDGDTIYYCQANIPINTNKVTYENTISRGALKNKVSERLTSPNTTKTGWVAHYKASEIKNVNILTVNYNTNGGSVLTSQTVAEVYKVVEPSGINVRTEASANSTKIDAIKKGTTVTVIEKKTDSGYTWGKIIFNGKEAWIALTLNGTALATKVGTTYSHPYYVSNSLIYKNSTSSIYGKTYVYGGVADDLDDDTTFGLYRDGYTFKGWSLSPAAGTLIDKNKDLKAEDLSPTAANKAITVYAVWEQNAPVVTDLTVEKIYLSTIPQKEIYYIGEEIDKSSISLIVKHTDGSFERVNSGFTCTPSIVSYEGRQQVTVTYEGKIATFDITATQSKTRVNNATSKVASTGYFLPDSNSGTIFTTGGTYAGDVMQVLCRDGDYYLGLFPWNATTTTKENGVLMYFKIADIEVSGSVPSADEYFSMNPTGKENAVVLADTTIHYRPDGGATAVTYNGKAAPVNTVSKDSRVKVLFEMDGYYCIQTDKYTGFVSKNSVKLDSFVYTISANVENINVSKNEIIDTSAIKVSERKTDGTVTEIAMQNCTATLPSTDSVGQNQAIITHSNLSTLVSVSVTDVKISQLLIEKMPTKLAYVVGDSFNSAGIVVKAVYEDGKSEDVTSKVTYEASLNEEGNATVRVKYESSDAYVPVQVYEKPEVEILNADGYSGEKIIVPIHYFTTGDVIVPSSFEMTISYDASKMNYIGVENSAQFTVTNIDGDTLLIKYNGGDLILNNILANLEFKLSDDSSCYGTGAKITIDKLDLADSLGNKFETTLTSGEIFNLGVQEKVESSTDVQTEAPSSEPIESYVSDTVAKTEEQEITLYESESEVEVQTGNINIQYAMTGCNASLFNGGGILAVAILGVACAAFLKKKEE